MNLALTREATYHARPASRWPRLRVNYGELAAKVCILTLFSGMAMRLAQNAAETGHVTGMLMLASEALVVALTLIRRTAGVVDRSWRARLLTTVSMVGPLMVVPAAAALVAESATVPFTAAGLTIVTAASRTCRSAAASNLRASCSAGRAACPGPRCASARHVR